MKSDISLAKIVHALGTFVKRYHTILFFLGVSGGLFTAIVMLLAIISLSSSTATSSDNAINGTFDEATIQRIEQDSSQPATPGSRKSPFVE